MQNPCKETIQKALYFYASAMCPIYESGKDLNLEGETHTYVS